MAIRNMRSTAGKNGKNNWSEHYIRVQANGGRKRGEEAEHTWGVDTEQNIEPRQSGITLASQKNVWWVLMFWWENHIQGVGVLYLCSLVWIPGGYSYRASSAQHRYIWGPVSTTVASSQTMSCWWFIACSARADIQRSPFVSALLCSFKWRCNVRPVSPTYDISQKLQGTL